MLSRLLTFADYFLPSAYREGEKRSRARTAIFLFLLSIVMTSSTTLIMTLQGMMLPKQTAILSFVILFMGVCLYLVKKTRYVEWITIIHLCFVGLTITLDSIFVSKSLHSANLQVFPLALLFGFFICPGWWKRWALTSWYMICLFACYFAMKDGGFTVPYALPVDKFISQLILATTARAAIALLTVNFYVRVKSIAENDLEKELNWQMQSLKLGEISLMTQLLVPHLKTPLENFARELNRLKDDINILGPEILQRMKEEVQAMTRIAQGTSWIYKAYRNESTGRTTSSVFQDQIAYLLTRKAEASRSRIQLMIEPAEEFALEGPLPTVLLLILTLFERTLSRMKTPLRNLKIEAIRMNSSIVWRIKYDTAIGDERPERLPLDGEDAQQLSFDNLREEFIEELSFIAKASVREFTMGGERVIEIRGNWVAADPGKALELSQRELANA